MPEKITKVAPVDVNRTALYVPQTQVRPVNGDVLLRCGPCGGMDFRVHVSPEGAVARASKLICLKCARVRSVDREGAYINDTGELTFNG